MKHILTFIFALGILSCTSQEISVNKIVLSTDSIVIYNIKYPSTQFGPSYFLCLQEYTNRFSDDAFNTLTANFKKYSPDIITLKASDNKSVVCIFPKHALKGISNLHGFISTNFDTQLIEQIKLRRTVHIQVTNEYDPANKEEEKGFKGFN